MSDLISRAGAIKALLALYEYQRSIDQTEAADLVRKGVFLAEQRIENLPSAQPEIIRCKDCKHYYFADNRVPSEQSWVCDAWGVDQTAHMGYCFKAERKDNE